MSNPKLGPRKGGDENGKRNLPSWMSSQKDGTESHRNKQVGFDSQEEGYEHKKPKEATDDVEEQSSSTYSREAGQPTLQFSKLLDGVVFVLSGFVNPERGILRSQALEMGAKYRPDWTTDCTLLVCAFPNTPKFRQVEEECGTIVSKDWISECYNQKKLIDIEMYLMHVGNPWRKNNNIIEAKQDQENVLPGKPQKQSERTPHPKMTSAVSKDGAPWGIVRNQLSPSKVKEWAINDLTKTVSWLEIQEEKPEPDEIKKIAAEGIITCLQDAIVALEKNEDIRRVIEQWNFVPRIVKELAELESGQSRKGSISKEELTKLALHCKQIYGTEFDNLDNSPVKGKKLKIDRGDDDDEPEIMPDDDAAFDSDTTIEMTEEEIDLACKGLARPENFDWGSRSRSPSLFLYHVLYTWGKASGKESTIPGGKKNVGIWPYIN